LNFECVLKNDALANQKTFVYCYHQFDCSKSLWKAIPQVLFLVCLSLFSRSTNSMVDLCSPFKLFVVSLRRKHKALRVEQPGCRSFDWLISGTELLAFVFHAQINNLAKLMLCCHFFCLRISCPLNFHDFETFLNFKVTNFHF